MGFCQGQPWLRVTCHCCDLAKHSPARLPVASAPGCSACSLCQPEPQLILTPASPHPSLPQVNLDSTISKTDASSNYHTRQQSRAPAPLTPTLPGTLLALTQPRPIGPSFSTPTVTPALSLLQLQPRGPCQRPPCGQPQALPLHPSPTHCPALGCCGKTRLNAAAATGAAQVLQLSAASWRWSRGAGSASPSNLLAGTSHTCVWPLLFTRKPEMFPYLCLAMVCYPQSGDKSLTGDVRQHVFYLASNSCLSL